MADDGVVLPASLILCRKASKEGNFPDLTGIQYIITTQELASGATFFYSIAMQEPHKSCRISVSIFRSKPFFAKAKKANAAGILSGHCVTKLYNITPGRILFELRLGTEVAATWWAMVAGPSIPPPTKPSDADE